MTALQKFAWYNLIVVCLTLVAVLVLMPLIGKGALGAFGLLGLIGLGPFLFRKKAGQILTDERDALIQKRSWILAYALFWVVYVLAASLIVVVVYGQQGAVPVWVVQSSVFCGFMLVNAAASIAILVQYRRDMKDAG